MKILVYLLRRNPCFLLFPLLCCHNNIVTTIDLATQLSGVYKVHHLQVFGQIIDTSHDFKGIVTITKIDTSHVKLVMDIRYLKDEPMPIETLCTLHAFQNKMQLIETKTNQVLGYVENHEIYIMSSDSNETQTKIIGLLKNE